MLISFLTSHRSAIVGNAKARMLNRRKRPDDQEISAEIGIFLDHVQSSLQRDPEQAEGEYEGLGTKAGQHGRNLLQMGLTIGQVVHDYGDVCQAITQTVTSSNVPISGEEFQTLNACLDSAIAGAVTAYAEQMERRLRGQYTEKIGVLAHEFRNLLGTAMLSFGAMRDGKVAVGGSTGMVLHRSLLGLRNLVDCSLVDVRLEAGIEKFELISVVDLVEEVEMGGLLQAKARDLILTVGTVDREASVDGDRQILASILSNLLHNAFKFTHKQGSVDLSIRTTDDSVFFDVRDECGGLPPGQEEEMFQPYSQAGADKSGVGLGLSICVKAAHRSGGEITVRNLPDRGCIFTLRLPRAYRPPLKAIPGGKSERTTSGSTVKPTGEARAPKSRAV